MPGLRGRACTSDRDRESHRRKGNPVQNRLWLGNEPERLVDTSCPAGGVDRELSGVSRVETGLSRDLPECPGDAAALVRFRYEQMQQVLLMPRHNDADDAPFIHGDEVAETRLEPLTDVIDLESAEQLLGALRSAVADNELPGQFRRQEGNGLQVIGTGRSDGGHVRSGQFLHHRGSLAGGAVQVSRSHDRPTEQSASFS